ncbi:MAG: hypothetical protein GEV11_09735 [Streptosporangiales bacterium]|nr:hypothetical protein [Streptosporangiales bacterium]
MGSKQTPAGPARRHLPGLRAAVLAAGLVLAAGCGIIGGSGTPEESAGGTPAPGSSGAGGAPGGPVKRGGPYNADQLAEALKAPIPKLVPTHDITKGRFGGLQVALDAIDPNTIPPEVKVTPAKCKAAIWSGPGKQALANSPAAFVQFGDPEASNQSEPAVFAWSVLIDAAGKDPKSALGKRAEGCSRIRIGYQGVTTTLAEQPAPEIGTGARATILSTSDGSSPRTWIVTYAGNGYIGEVLVQGPAKRAQVNAIATAAAQKAQQTLG